MERKISNRKECFDVAKVQNRFCGYWNEGFQTEGASGFTKNSSGKVYPAEYF